MTRINVVPVTELWRPVVRSECWYEVSNLGNVRSKDRIIPRYDPRTGKYINQTFKSKILSKTDFRGYFTCHIRYKNEDSGHHRLIHRLVAEAFIENPENKPHVNHIDGDGTNNNVLNLEWCTHIENMKHAIETKLLIPSRSLNKEQVIKLRFLSNRGWSQRRLAKYFDISQCTVHNILSNKVYKELL